MKTLGDPAETGERRESAHAAHVGQNDLGAPVQNRPGTFTLRFAILLVLSAQFLTACGTPDNQETGEILFVIWPLPLLLGVGLHVVYYLLWRRLSPEAEFRWLPSAAVLVFGILLAQYADGDSWSIIHNLDILRRLRAITVIGTLGLGYVLLQFAITYIWLDQNPRDAFTWSPVASSLIYALPAYLMASGAIPGTSLFDPILMICILSLFLFPIVPIFLVVLFVRSLRAGRTQEGVQMAMAGEPSVRE